LQVDEEAQTASDPQWDLESISYALRMIISGNCAAQSGEIVAAAAHCAYPRIHNIEVERE
jgi:hypothetical protein